MERVKPKMKKSQKTLWKKITHIFILIFMVTALTLGIIFSIFKIDASLAYGADFIGGFEATVAVQKRDPNKTISDEQIAKGLEDKLSPFNDLPIAVSFKGKDRLTVAAGKNIYNNNQTLFRSSIEANGGMFVLTRNSNNEYEDLYTNPEALKTINDTSNERINASKLFSDTLSVQSLTKESGRAPYISLGLNQDSNGQFYWSKIVEALMQQQIQDYYFVTDFEVLINRIKELYTLNQNDRNLIKAYWTNVIEIAQKYINEPETDIQTKETLRDLFSGTISWVVRGTGTGFRRNAEISLLDTKFTPATNVDVNGRRIQGIENADDLADILEIFRPNLERSLDYFVYPSDASATDLQSEKYKDNRVSYLNRNKVDLGSVQKTFKTVTNFFLNKIIVDEEKTNSNGRIVINDELNKIDPTIKEHFIFNGSIITNHDERILVNDLTRTSLGFITVNIKNGTSNSLAGGLYLPAESLTVGRKAVASIIQNALGINYRVESIIEINALISTNWLLVATIVLLIIAVLLAVYLLFVYRLLGLFTLIIAVMSASLMFIIANLFGIAISAQFIMALFLIIGLVIDISLILFDSFTAKLYQDKQAIKTAFKISNKETITITVDALIVALIPNLVMFWVADGDLKNFATLATIGIFLVLFFGVVILRFISWSLLNLPWFQKAQWLLPINTNYDLNVSFKNQYLINKYRLFLERVEGKEKLSSKELLKIQEANQKLTALTKEVEKQKLANLNKAKLKDQKEIQKLHDKQVKLAKRREKFLAKEGKFKAIKHPVIKYLDVQSKNIENVLSSETLINVAEKNKESVASTLKIWKTERRFNKFGLILSFIVIVFTIIGSIIGVTVGPNWSSSFGQGQEFVVYGQRIHETYRNTIGQNRPTDLNSELSKQADLIKEDYAERMIQAQENLNNSDTADSRIANQKALYLLEAEQLEVLYNFVISNNLFSKIHNQALDIDLKDWKIAIVDNYSFNNDNGTNTNNLANELAITINTNATDKFSRTNFRRLLVYLSDPRGLSPWRDSEDDHRDENGGIVAYDVSPFTTTNLIKQILIVFGILLLALIIYMIIRFKWTYYVALALGLILTLAFTFAAVFVFRIPVTIELLSGFALLISFISLTMIFLLGKGKSLLNFDDKNELNKKFAKEIQSSEKIHAQKKVYKDEISVLKVELKTTKKTLAKLLKQIKNFEEVDENKVIDLKVKKTELQLDIKKLKKDNRLKFKEMKNEEKIKIKQVSQSNFFFKELYMDLIKFMIRRILTIGLFYMLTALVLLITLAPMFGMGIIVLIGIIIGFVVTLFIVIPVWIFLEQKRIRRVNGFKNYMKNIKVSHEEQIVAGIND